MRHVVTCWVVAAGVALVAQSSALATLPYAEQFPTNNANWSRDNNNTIPAVWQANGGPNGGPHGSSHVSVDFSAFTSPAGTDHILFQARDENNSSNHNFEGNWFADGINEFSMWVKHSAPMPIPFFARFTNAAGTTGVAAIRFAPVLSNTWTRISFEIDPSNINHPTNNPTGQLFVEGPPMLFNSTFTNVRHVQVGFRTPAGLGALNQSFTYRLDRPAINAVPEPASLILIGMATMIPLFGLRRRTAGN
jgi:hypothetical protein